MKRFLGILLTVLLSLTAFASVIPSGSEESVTPADSLRRAQLGEKIDEYVDAIALYPLPDQEAECDFLIRSCQDSLDRQFVAVRLYDRYLNSPLLGSENVAVHIVDEWFLSGKVEMYNEMDYINAFAFTEFNRSSLIGKPAPELKLKTVNNEPVYLCPPGGTGSYTALYFYSPGCATCRLTTPMITKTLARRSSDVVFYAINTDTDAERWGQYQAENEQFHDLAFHVWDPEIASDYQRLYGVTQTPQLFLIDPKGIIIGRRLDAEALETMLSNELDLYEGSLWEDAASLIENVMATGGTVGEIHSMIRRRTEDNPRTRKILTAALLHYAMTHRGHDLRFGADTLARQILAEPDIWWTENDMLSVVSLASMSVSLMDLAPVGARIPNGKVHGTLLRGDREKTGSFRLRRICGRDHRLVFYSPGCRDCQALLETVDAFRAAHPETRILLVNMDELCERHPAEAEAVLEALDLTTLPMVIATGRRGRVTDKYLDNL